jgi:CheY-like chemotaxis protein
LCDATHRAQAADHQKSELLAWASREMRSPLTAILGQCDLATMDPKIIGRGARQMLNILDALLDPEKLNAQSEPQDSIVPSPQPRAQGLLEGRVLLVEDSDDSRPVIEFYLKETGVEVTTVADGKAAYTEAMWAVARGTPFDLILMDTRMPILDGCATTILLRNSKYMAPIVALSANATEEDRVRCFTAGHNGFLAKPIVPAQLAGVLARHLRRASGTTADTFNLLTSVAQRSSFTKLVDSFKSEIPRRIEAIEEAAAAGDGPKVSELAHQLKGTAGCYGLAAISAAAGAIQTAADHFQSPSDVQPPVTALRDLWREALKSAA